MFNASAQFHAVAAEDGTSIRVLLQQGNTIFTDENILLSSGVNVTEAVNLEDNLTVGLCPSAEINTTILNPDGLLNGFGFGEMNVSLGVLVGTAVENFSAATVTAILNYGETEVVLSGHSTVPYFKIDGSAAALQPSFAVKGIFVYDTRIILVGASSSEIYQLIITDGTWAALEPYTWAELAGATWAQLSTSGYAPIANTLNSFMTAKLAAWASSNRGLVYDSASRILNEFFQTAKRVDTYEYVPLGVFLIDKPSKQHEITINISGLDKMRLFDKEASTFFGGLTYPTTLGDIYADLCEFVGLETDTTSFINDNIPVAAAPMSGEMTARDILKYIAEAACAYARMTREGKIELAWFVDQTASVSIDTYFAANIAEYEVQPIDKLQVKTTEEDWGVVVGTGTNGYVMLGNPFVNADTDLVLRGYATLIYNRLAAMEEYTPITVRAMGDWSVQAGDIVEFVDQNANVYNIPVFVQTIEYNGSVRIIYESMGDELRPVLAASNRIEFTNNQKFAKITFTIDGLDLALTNNRLTFDANGLHIYNGGFDIWNDSTKVFGVDTEGNVLAVGTFESESGDWKATLSAAELLFEYQGSERGFVGGDGATLVFEGQRFQAVSNGTEYGRFYALDGFGGRLIIDNEDGNAAHLFTSAFGNGRHDLYADTGGVDTVAVLSLDATSTARGMTVKDDSATTIGFIGYDGTNTTAKLIPATQSGVSANAYFAADGSLYALKRVTSSIRYKKNVEDFQMNSEIIDNVRPVTFEEKLSDSGQRYLGFIAEEVFNVCPELVVLNEDGEPDSVNYDRIPVLLIKDAQHTHARLTALEEAIRRLG